MTHGETSGAGPAQTVAVLGARRLAEAVAEHGDEDISATYLTSAPEQAA